VKPKTPLAACLLAAVLSAACVKSSQDSGPKVRPGSNVRLAYDLIVDGKTLRSVTPQNPLTFVHGSQNLAPGFRDGLVGMRAGETKDIVVPPAQGFGAHDPKLVEPVPLGAFPKDFALEPGRLFQMKRNGVMHDARVVGIEGKNALIDFNHPLAGKTLTFHAKVLFVSAP